MDGRSVVKAKEHQRIQRQQSQCHDGRVRIIIRITVIFIPRRSSSNTHQSKSRTTRHGHTTTTTSTTTIQRSQRRRTPPRPNPTNATTKPKPNLQPHHKPHRSNTPPILPPPPHENGWNLPLLPPLLCTRPRPNHPPIPLHHGPTVRV